MGVVQRNGAGSNPLISRVVSKSDRPSITTGQPLFKIWLPSIKHFLVVPGYWATRFIHPCYREGYISTG